jgi:hypothetical protein
VSESLVLSVKKLQNGIKDLETVRREAKNQSNRLSLDKKCVAAAIAWNPLKANSSLLVPTRYCFARHK